MICDECKRPSCNRVGSWDGRLVCMDCWRRMEIARIDASDWMQRSKMEAALKAIRMIAIAGRGFELGDVGEGMAISIIEIVDQALGESDGGRTN